jgi:hypothetical protein
VVFGGPGGPIEREGEALAAAACRFAQLFLAQTNLRERFLAANRTHLEVK